MICPPSSPCILHSPYCTGPWSTIQYLDFLGYDELNLKHAQKNCLLSSIVFQLCHARTACSREVLRVPLRNPQPPTFPSQTSTPSKNISQTRYPATSYERIRTSHILRCISFFPVGIPLHTLQTLFFAISHTSIYRLFLSQTNHYAA